MNGVFISLLAFVVAIGALVTVHEFGHYWVARRLGVKVLRFSIGFGKPLWSRTFGDDRTELVVAAIPLGGYVKMLDEREGEVDAGELHRAFNRKPLSTRAAVVVAGPLFNFLFAIFVYWAMFVAGVPGLRPVVGDVQAGSYAAAAGILSGDEIISVGGKQTPTWESTVMALLDVGLDEQPSITLTVRGADGQMRRLQSELGDGILLEKGGVLENFGIGLWQLPPVIDEIVAGGAAERAGLLGGDRILGAGDTLIDSWNEWVMYVRDRPGEQLAVRVLRAGAEIDLVLVPERKMDAGQAIGFIGASVQLPDQEQRDTMRVVVRHGLLGAFPAALGKTREVTTLTLRTLWKMVTGKASVENLSGPISIAQYAGQSATIGLAAFLGFLGIVSVSLGVLNLLPVPILDGGHLLYYLVELVKGSPVSEATQLVGQKIGIVMLLTLMSVAFYNDILRLVE
ncbi:MAG: RIP metalloprotease RseP [Gammaproteobacteria bacterium]|nr:RIP metalloprotease RseP [Gammaproteobacteria bacterium]MDH5513828.1 RIP metalloprotease RseP [Gammaproteobacteria bacterium]